ncbi:MAG TPA: SDR family NAD(P)-dependent oxidoreductase, partial [Caulobacteraceae bacterium]
MAGRLSGKTCLITAAGQGIGRATAERFIAEGARVLATDIDEAALAGLAAAETQRLDVTDAAAIAAL